MYKDLITLYQTIIYNILHNNSVVNNNVVIEAYLSTSKALDHAVVHKQTTKEIEDVRKAEIWLLTNL